MRGNSPFDGESHTSRPMHAAGTSIKGFSWEEAAAAAAAASVAQSRRGKAHFVGACCFFLFLPPSLQLRYATTAD